MIKTELLDKRSICHALIYSTNNPEILIPIKGIVEDIHFDDDIPFYSIKLIKFYDNIFFLNENLIDRPFLLKHKGKPKKFHIPKFKNVPELENWFIDECSHRFCIESTMVVRSKSEMVELFNKVQEYLVIKNLRLIRDTSTRPLYDGKLKIASKIEFKERLKRMIGDKFDQGEFDQFIEFI
jgi:hypothetical protein